MNTMIAFIDDFERVDSDDLGNNWIESGGNRNKQTILNNLLNYNVGESDIGAVPFCTQLDPVNQHYNRELCFSFRDNGSDPGVLYRVAFAYFNSVTWIGFEIDPSNLTVNIVESLFGLISTKSTLELPNFLGTFREFKLIQRSEKIILHAEKTGGDFQYVGVFDLQGLTSILNPNRINLSIIPKRSSGQTVLADFKYISIRNISGKRRY